MLRKGEDDICPKKAAFSKRFKSAMLKSFSVFLLLVDVADFVMDFTYTRMLAREGHMGHAAWLGCVSPVFESEVVLVVTASYAGVAA